MVGTALTARDVAFHPDGAVLYTRSVHEMLSEFGSVGGFQPVADGATDDTVAFQAAQAGGGMVFVPPGDYAIVGPITTVANSWFFAPNANLTNWSTVDLIRGPQTDIANGSNVWRLADRVFVGAAAGAPGTSTRTAGATFVSDTSNFNSGWIERSATVFGVSPWGGIGGAFASRTSDGYSYFGYGTIWAAGQTVAIGAKRGYLQRLYHAASAGVTGATPPTHTTGTVSDGAVNWTFDAPSYQTAIGAAFVCMHDVADGYAGWASYFEVQRAAGAGTCFALEIDVKNKGSNVTVDSYNDLTTGASIGIWLAAGGDATLGAPANPSTAAIAIGNNATTWNTGIVFQNDGLTQDGSGFMTAMSLPQKALIKWWVAAGIAGANIRSEVSDGVRPTQFIFINDGFEFITRASLAFLVMNQSGGNPVNCLQASGVSTGNAPSISAVGSDTNISLRLIPKGTGLVKYGAFTGSADAPTIGTVSIEDDGGTIRKLMVAA